MEKQETKDEFIKRVKTEMLNAKPGEMVVLQPGETSYRIARIDELAIFISGHCEQQRSGDTYLLHYLGELKRSEEDKTLKPTTIKKTKKCKHPPDCVLLENGYPERCTRCGESFNVIKPK